MRRISITLAACALWLTACGQAPELPTVGEAVDKVESTLMQLHTQDSVRPHEGPQPMLPEGSVALDAVALADRLTPEEASLLLNPFADDPDAVEAGRVAYRHYCWPCHGPGLDGQSIVDGRIATAGPSLPQARINLLSPQVASQSDGTLFYKTLLGAGSHPALDSTMSEDNAWLTISYIRAVESGATRPGEPAGWQYGVLVPGVEAE